MQVADLKPQFAKLRGVIASERVLRALKRNLALRIISVAIAVGLWLFVNTGERAGLVDIAVPISYRSLPAGMVIINHPPDFVKIDVSGPHNLLTLLDPERLALRLNLTKAPTGESEFQITTQMFGVPRSTTVTRVTPGHVTVDIDRVISREVPVHLAIEGKVSDGYKIGAIQIRPATVAVSGPSRFALPLTRIDTEPFDVRGANASAERAVDLVPPSASVRLALYRVLATVDVGEVIADREFRSVSLQVRDSDYRFRVSPPKVNVTIRGPALRLAGLDPNGHLYVDADGLKPGSHDVSVQAELPDGMKLVRQAPDKVRLRVYRERLPSTADGRSS